MRPWHLSLLLLGCASRGGFVPGTGDLAMPGDNTDLLAGDLGGAPADLARPADLMPAAPTELDCYYNWKTLSGCPAPQITDTYLSNDCDGTTGVFVIGRYFQHGNQYDYKNGWLPHGPYALSGKLNRDTWNWITPRMVCITTSADPGYWSGFDMQVRNPDGQVSNTLTVQNRLGNRPPLPSTDSTDPFDPNACYEAGMTMAEAVAKFPAGMSMTTLGTLTIQSRSRPCNTLTGCAAWGAAATETTAAARLLTAASVHFALGTTDCGPLGGSDYTLTYNDCTAGGAAGSYEVHVAAACLMLWQTARTTPAGDGSYTQTDYGAVLRF